MTRETVNTAIASLALGIAIITLLLSFGNLGPLEHEMLRHGGIWAKKALPYFLSVDVVLFGLLFWKWRRKRKV